MSMLTLRSVAPLPTFSIPYTLPDPSTSISSFKLSILGILTGHSKALTFSEELKEKTVNGWRMSMLSLQLGQQPDQEDLFQLKDDHECSLFEDGDEVVVSLKEGYDIKELQLPDLGKGFKYGTIPPPYEVVAPAEPSSHSSSVGAQPNANYHQHNYTDWRAAHKVVTSTNNGGRKGPITSLANKVRPKKERSASQPKILSDIPATSRRNSSSSPRLDQTPSMLHGSGKPAGQASMPRTALVIGPGVQGAVGRNAPSASAPIGSAQVLGGNATAFAGFTAASGEVRVKPPRKSSKTRVDTENITERPNRDGQVSSSSNKTTRVDLPVLPPIQNLAPFNRERDLPLMPCAAESPKAQPAFLPKFSSRIQSTSSAPQLEETEGTKAEKRYAEIQRSLAKEREKQAEAERLRGQAIKASDQRKRKEAEKKQADAKQQEEERKWEMWQEVRRRQKAVAPPPPVKDGPCIELGLERITRLLSRLDSPHHQFPVIHVAGTNGKGSVIAYLDALLSNALNIRTGTFNSPHLIERRDSCKINGQVISQEIWQQAQYDVLAADQGLVSNDDGNPLKASPFELLTAQTFQAFSLSPQKPQVLLIEVGLGGRLDATNVFTDTQVLASIICPIAKDHESFLGNTLSSIAFEKAGIIKPNGLCIVADQRDPTTDSPMDQTALGPLEAEIQHLGERAAGIVDTIRNVCITKNARLVKTKAPFDLLSQPPLRQEGYGAQVEFAPRLGPILSLSTSGYNPPTTFVAHPGNPSILGPTVKLERTLANLTGASTALQTLFSIAHDTLPTFDALRTEITWGLRSDPSAHLLISSSLANASWPGRCSWLTPRLLVDGAHNPASALALRSYISAFSPPSINWILSFSEGKDVTQMLQHLLEGHKVPQRVALTSFTTPVEGMPWVKPMDPHDAQKVVRRWVKETEVCTSWEEARAWAQKAEGVTIVAGSLYLVGDVYRAER